MPYVKQITIRSTLNRSLKYIVNDKKTDYGCFVTGVNCATSDKLAYKQMLANKKRFKKESGTLGFHFIQSFKENEISDPYKAHEIGLKWADKMFGDKYQFIISTHLDKGHVHNHVIINSVSLEGKKFNACKKSLQEARDFSDEISKEYDLNIIPYNKESVPKSYKEWNEEKRGNSWKAHIKSDIDTVLDSSKSFEDFMSKMQQLGYTTKQGHVKYMTFKAPGMERSVRGKTLGPNYTEDRIKERIQLKQFNFVESKRKYKYRFKTKTSRSHLIDVARSYRYKRGSLAVNLMLSIALIRAIASRNAAESKRRNTRRDFSGEIEIAKLSNQLQYITEHNLKSKADLKLATQKIELQMQQVNAVMVEANEMVHKIGLVNQTIETYNKYKPIFEEYQAATIKKMIIKKKYGPELDTFEKAFNQLNKLGIQEKDFSSYVQRESSYELKIRQLTDRLNAFRMELYKIKDIEATLDRRDRGYIVGKKHIKKNEER